MKLIEIVLISIGLAMDAFAVSICKGLAMKKMSWKKAVIIGAYFGFFQGAMPLVGYFLGINFQEKVTNIDHWIAFVLLAIVGINMLKEAFSIEEELHNEEIKFKEMIILSIATSIDALAIGITLAFLNVNIIESVIIIGIITFIISLFGVKIGNVFGNKYERKAQIAGGLILIALGIKILLEHLNII